MTEHDSIRIGHYITPVDDAYASCERTCAELRIYSGEIMPSEVTHLLGIPPTDCVAKDERATSLSTGRVRIGKLNGWFLSSESNVASKDLRRHLDCLLDELEPRSVAIRKLQEQSGMRMVVHCIWWSKYGGGGPTLWPEQMRRLAALNLECSFDFQYYGEESSERDQNEISTGLVDPKQDAAD